MNLRELKLNQSIIAKLKENKDIQNDRKVDLDYLANYWDNIIKMVEKEVKQKSATKGVAFRLYIEVE